MQYKLHNIIIVIAGDREPVFTGSHVLCCARSKEGSAIDVPFLTLCSVLFSQAHLPAECCHYVGKVVWTFSLEIFKSMCCVCLCVCVYMYVCMLLSAIMVVARVHSVNSIFGKWFNIHNHTSENICRHYLTLPQ